jgi:hypothetical protein
MSSANPSQSWRFNSGIIHGLIRNWEFQGTVDRGLCASIFIWDRYLSSYGIFSSISFATCLTFETLFNLSRVHCVFDTGSSLKREPGLLTGQILLSAVRGACLRATAQMCEELKEDSDVVFRKVFTSHISIFKGWRNRDYHPDEFPAS